MEELKKFLNEEQDPKTVEKLFKKVSELLTKDETIEYIAVQKKPAINLSPDCIALTNKRVIFCRPKTLGLSMEFQDFLWKDVADCHMKEGILGATFSVRTLNKRFVALDYLPKAQVRKLYRFAQEREEEMIDYRRDRELEKARASAGGIVLNTNESKEKTKDESAQDPVEKLKQLKKMLEAELISQEEFDLKKKEILSSM